MSALAITIAPSDELLSVEDAKRHLRLYSSDLDDEVASKIRSARDYCERFTQRTLRKTTTRTLTPFAAQGQHPRTEQLGSRVARRYDGTHRHPDAAEQPAPQRPGHGRAPFAAEKTAPESL